MIIIIIDDERKIQIGKIYGKLQTTEIKKKHLESINNYTKYIQKKHISRKQN